MHIEVASLPLWTCRILDGAFFEFRLRKAASQASASTMFLRGVGRRELTGDATTMGGKENSLWNLVTKDRRLRLLRQAIGRASDRLGQERTSLM